MIAEKILRNGAVYSVNNTDEIFRAEAVAIADGKIAAVGAESDIMKFASETTQIIDCHGNTIMTGFTDAHCHPGIAASMFENCSLFEISATPEETSQTATDRYTEAMAEFIKERPEQTVYRGTGWNRAFFMGTCKNAKWPTRHDLDRVCSDKPVIMESYCQHAMWVNTKALEMAGLNAETPDPVNGSFTREKDGYPEGVFFEMDAINLVKENMPNYDYTVEQYKNTLLKFQDEIALPYGILCANDCLTTENAITALKELAREEKLKMRFRAVYHYRDCTDLDYIDIIDKRKGTDNISDLFEINTIKTFIDGSMALEEPYLKSYNIDKGLPEDYAGDAFYDEEILTTAYEKAADTGLQIHVHAMGGRAIRQAVNALASAQKKTGKYNRNVIAHHMEVADDIMKLMADNQILANVQPRWMVCDEDAAENYVTLIGEDRAYKVYPNKRFLNAGCDVVYGTDFPVTEISPFVGIQCAITRCVYEGGHGYEQYKGVPLGPKDDPLRDCVTLKDAVKSYTYMGAYQNFMENYTGSIEAGKSADILILNDNIETINVSDIHKMYPVKTIFKGEIVYSAE